MHDVERTTSTVEELGSLLHHGKGSSAQLLQMTLARIEELDTDLNTFITLTPDDALEAARQADTEIERGERRSALHGLPVGIKDAIDVAGVRCTFGSRILADRTSPADAAVVRSLRAAGAVIVGKQNQHEFAFGITGENPHFGDVKNPWDPARIAGGSSSGTAASIAAGLLPLGVGTDTGGSVRIPAAMCGIVGLKPTYGLVSLDGVLPLAPSLDHVGPMGRTVLDCLALFDAIADDADGRASGRTVGIAYSASEAAASGLSGVRVGIPREYFFDGVERSVERAVDAALATLRGLGARLVEVSLPRVAHCQEAGLTVMASEAASWHEAWLRTRPDDYGADIRQRLEDGLQVRAVDYLSAQAFRVSLREDFERAFDEADVIVSPTVPIVAPIRGRTFDANDELGVAPRSVINRLTIPANLTGLPAITVPCGTNDGLPVGLQVMGASGQEATIGTVALAYERENDRPSHSPGILT
jgi:aspartyl-tRNA(Asn)/glutamyl-tRNA(Gln) amidotransferase subunit A